MSQAQTVEAARARIQRLVDEIAALSKNETRSEDYYSQFLTRAVAACDGRGGAVWLIGPRTAEGKSEFQLAAQVDLESSLFQSDEEQRGLLLRALSEVIQTKKPMVLAADKAPSAATGAPGSLQAQLSQMAGAGQQQQQSQNKTPFPFIHVPLFLKDQVLGVLQIWLQDYVTRENYAEFATFLGQLAAHVEQYLQSRRMGNMVVENQRLQHLLKFIGDITGTLEPLEVGRLTTNYSRDLLGCDRCVALRRRGSGWEILSISGQEVVEKKGAAAKAMAGFVTAHLPIEPQPFTPDGSTVIDVRPHVIAIGKKELLALADGTGTDVPESRALILRPHGPTNEADAAYFDLGQVASSLLVQMIDGDKQVVGALLAESSVEGFFEAPPTAKEAPPSHRLGEWIAGNSGRALRAALDHTELPFLFATKRLRQVKRKVFGTGGARYTFFLLLWIAIIGGILFFPWMEEVESDCTLIPEKRVKIVPETAGCIEKVFVREGTLVKKGDKLAQLDISALRAELLHALEDRQAATAEVEKYRGMGDPASEQIAMTKVRASDQKVKRLEQDIAAGTLLAPFDGIVLTKDIELSEGVYVSPGTDFAVIGSTEKWDLQVHLHEKQVGKVENLMEEKPEVEVRFILYSANSEELTGILKDRTQLSQVAYPHQRENALQENSFVLTLPDIQAPKEVRRTFRPDLTGRASIRLGRRPVIFMWGRNIAQWFRLKWVW